MSQRRRQFYSIIPVLGLMLFLVGCPKTPATTTAAAPPAPSPAAPAPPSPAPPTAVQPTPSPGGPPAVAATPPAAPVKPPAPAEFRAVADLKDIHFDFDTYNIRPGDAKILEEDAKWMKSNPRHLILIEGHADERGTNEYNLALGERRAKSAMNSLVSMGIQASRITIISYGEERQTCAEKNEECWQKNRRDHFLVKPQ